MAYNTAYHYTLSSAQQERRRLAHHNAQIYVQQASSSGYSPAPPPDYDYSPLYSYPPPSQGSYDIEYRDNYQPPPENLELPPFIAPELPKIEMSLKDTGFILWSLIKEFGWFLVEPWLTLGLIVIVGVPTCIGDVLKFIIKKITKAMSD